MKPQFSLLMLLLIADPAAALDLPLPTVTENVGGVPVAFEGTANLAFAENCTDLRAEITVNLRDLNANLTRIVKASGVERSESCGDSVSISGAHLSAGLAGDLAVKVDGNVSRQECVITKVPEFRGLKITMKDRTVASNTFATNASVAATFTPEILDGTTLRMRLVSGPHTEVSNDAYGFLISAFDLQGRIDGAIRGAVEGALADEATWLQLPPEVQALGLRAESAAMVQVDEAPALRVTGTVPVPATMKPMVTTLLGFSSCP